MNLLASPAPDVDDGPFVPRRGRPSSRQAVAITGHVLRVARTLLLSQGYAGTSMDAVAAAAGVSKSTLYTRFPGKEDLFRAIVAERLEAWAMLAPSTFPDEFADVRDRLVARARAVLDVLREPEIKAFRRLILAEADRFPELARDLEALAYRRVIDEVARDLVVAAGGLPIADAHGVAATFIAALLGWWQGEASVHEVSREESDAFAARLVSVLVGGRLAW